jgi:hypothetical protein
MNNAQLVSDTILMLEDRCVSIRLGEHAALATAHPHAHHDERVDYVQYHIRPHRHLQTYSQNLAIGKEEKTGVWS